MASKTSYTVHRHLAGYSAARHWVRDYISLSAAKKKADEVTGYGQFGKVVDNRTSEIVYYGNNN